MVLLFLLLRQSISYTPVSQSKRLNKYCINKYYDMQQCKLILTILSFSLFITSCGNGTGETVKADSTITSASITTVPVPATINTDTTTAAPVADTASSGKPADTVAHKAPSKKKTDKKKVVKKNNKTGKATKKTKKQAG